MGANLVRSFYMEDEPINDPENFEKFRDYQNEGRPVREMQVTKEQMDIAQLPRQNRDYCAHRYMAYKKCIREWFPQFGKCSHALHDYHHCTLDDEIIRMKEYERVRRLMKREKEKQMAEVSA